MITRLRPEGSRASDRTGWSIVVVFDLREGWEERRRLEWIHRLTVSLEVVIEPVLRWVVQQQ